MRPSIFVAMIALNLIGTAADARVHHYYYGRSHSQCRRDKRNAGHQGIAIGAVAGGVGTALLGGGLGTSLLGAAAGGTAGNFIGRGTEHCADRHHAH